MLSKGLADSRQIAQALIMSGKVMVDLVPVMKPGTRILEASEIAVKGESPAYVSRGGLKLEAALKGYALGVERWVCLDVGASTGGFSDCLLQHGARHIYAVDVGYGQLAWKLRQDPRITVIERTNIRYMPDSRLPELVDLVTIDTSFISLRIVLPAVLKFIKPSGNILALIKPQFEIGKGKVGKGGVVRDKTLHEVVLKELTHFFQGLGLNCRSPIPSPIQGPKGNQEYFILLSKSELKD